jgi:hypothetical protein
LQIVVLCLQRGYPRRECFSFIFLLPVGTVNRVIAVAFVNKEKNAIVRFIKILAAFDLDLWNLGRDFPCKCCRMSFCAGYNQCGHSDHKREAYDNGIDPCFHMIISLDFAKKW